MNNVRTAVRKGFTLVEILIVVVILGILAAIVIPQFSSASQAAQASSTVTQLQSLRSQLELYQLQHEGNYPRVTGDGIVTGTAGDFWAQLTNFTDEAGTVYLTQADATSARTGGANIFGPYLQKPISNPFISSVGRADEKISVSTDEPLDIVGVAAFGFLYNPTTGEVRANVPTDIAAEVNFNTADGDISTF